MGSLIRHLDLRTLISTPSSNMKAMVSLIVLQSAVFCSAATAVKFLGVNPLPLPALSYAQESVSPSIYPLRTALDVLQPSVGYGYGYPWGLSGYYPQYPAAPVIAFQSPVISSSVAAPAKTVPVAVAETPVETPAVVDTVDVAEEVDADATPALGEISIREHIDALPSIPTSPFRNQPPVIPAGIAQATQPHFVQAVFKNPKLSPSLQLVNVINSKVSPALQEIRATGVELILAS